MPDLTLQPTTPPVDAGLPSTASELINLVSAYLLVQGAENLQGVVISETTPAVEDRDKGWIRIDPATARPLGLFVYQGTWVRLPVVVDSGAERPANPISGELFYNTTTGSLEYFGADGWSTNLIPSGNTAGRPAAAANNALYLDTEIGRLLRKTASGWTTVDGGVGDVKMVTGISEEIALERNPGWSVFTSLQGRFPIGANVDYPAGSDGGNETVAWSGVGSAAHGGSREAPAISSITIAGEQIAAAAGMGNATNPLPEKTFSIMPPYFSVIFLRKDF